MGSLPKPTDIYKCMFPKATCILKTLKLNMILVTQELHKTSSVNKTGVMCLT